MKGRGGHYNAPKIYVSDIPSVKAVRRSIFTYLFNTTTSTSPNPVAFVDADSGITLSRDRLKHLALSLAWGLRQRLLLPGISKSHPMTCLSRGDTVMLLGPNSLSWIITLFASAAAGLRVTPASSAHTAEELTWQWVNSNARAVFVAPSHVAVVLKMFSSLGIAKEEAKKRIWVVDDSLTPAATIGVNSLANLVGNGILAEEERFDGNDADETMYLCYSSGTTGRPKGVETTHQNIGAQLEMVAMASPFPKGSAAVLLNVLPFYHIFGIWMIHFSLFVGSSLVIDKRFDPEAFCKTIETYKVTSFSAAPPLLLALCEHPAVDRYDMRSVLTVFCGGATLPPALGRRFIENFLTRGVKVNILQGYGSTESSGVAQLVALKDATRKITSVGRLYPNLEARIVVYDSNDIPAWDAEEGQPGEIWLRGPTVMKGYVNNEAATKSTITPDGWLKMGDIMTRDSDGYFYIIDRKKDMIKYKGYQVSPTELEAVLLEHPKVGDVAVIGLIDDTGTNELPRAYIIPSDPTYLNSESARLDLQKSVKEWIEARVANYKFLRGGIMVVNAIPKSPTGKTLRRVLVDQAKAELKGHAVANLTAKL